VKLVVQKSRHAFNHKGRAMRVPGVRFKIPGLVVVATAMALLVGGLTLALKVPAPIQVVAPHRHDKRAGIILEGVDINSNGPQHSRTAILSEKRAALISGAIRLSSEP
jgi:hypothetical protein